MFEDRLDTQFGSLLPASFFSQPTVEVARGLLGKVLLHRDAGWTLGGIIVEVEAYLGSRDLASHSACGRTRRNAVMFEGQGHVYVYQIHQQHCVNIVTEAPSVGAAVLIRALEPLADRVALEEMGRRRKLADDFIREGKLLVSWAAGCTRGPGRLCQAMGIDLSQNGILVDNLRPRAIDESVSGIELRQLAKKTPYRIAKSRRIGITKSASRQLRFFVSGSPFVSGRASDHSRPRDLLFQDWYT